MDDTSQPIERAPDAGCSDGTDVGMDHGRVDILVPHKFLHRPNIFSIFEQTSRETVP